MAIETVPAPQDQDPHPDLVGMVARLAGDYCPSLSSTEVVDVARTAFSNRGERTIDEVESGARRALDHAAGQP